MIKITKSTTTKLERTVGDVIEREEETIIETFEYSDSNVEPEKSVEEEKTLKEQLKGRYDVFAKETTNLIFKSLPYVLIVSLILGYANLLGFPFDNIMSVIGKIIV